MIFQAFEHVDKSMPQETSKVIVDAEPNRRTLWETGESASVVWSWGQLQINETGVDKDIESHEKGTKIDATIDVKSIKIEVAPRRRYENFRGGALEPQRLNTFLLFFFGAILGTRFSNKSKKNNSKGNPQINI